jgi:hypothetical protein
MLSLGIYPDVSLAVELDPIAVIFLSCEWRFPQEREEVYQPIAFRWCDRYWRTTDMKMVASAN